jgi:hypothetical protein
MDTNKHRENTRNDDVRRVKPVTDRGEELLYAAYQHGQTEENQSNADATPHGNLLIN